MDGERVLTGTSRILAAAAGVTMAVAGWYVLMTVAFGTTPAGRSAAVMAGVGAVWVAAGGGAIAGGLLPSTNVRPAARLDLLAAVLVLASAPWAEAPLALVPGGTMLAAAVGERFARLRARRTATFTAVLTERAGAPPSPAPLRRVA